MLKFKSSNQGKRRFISLINFSLVFLLLSSSAQACIGVVTAGGGVNFWREVERGSRQAGKELHVDVYVRGAVDESNVNGQGLIIDKIVQLGCKGLVLAPNYVPERVDQVARLKEQGIPTVYIDRDIGGERVSVIQTDNFRAGELAGIEMASILKEKGSVAVMRLAENVVTTTQREEGFISAMTNAGYEVTISPYLGTSVSDIRHNVAQFLQSIPKLDGIFTPNETSSLGTLAVLKYQKVAGEIIHIGFDANQFMLNGVKDNQMQGLIVQQPFMLGYKGVYSISRLLSGKEIEQQIGNDVIYVNKDNIDSYLRKQ